MPELAVPQPVLPVRPEPRRPEQACGGERPSRGVNAVRHVPDGDLGDGDAWEKRTPHLPADPSVQFADAVGGAAESEREDGHRKRLLAVRMFAAEPHELVRCQPR